jgi:hypothetical protein
MWCGRDFCFNALLGIYQPVIARNEAISNYTGRRGQCRTCIAALPIGVASSLTPRNDVADNATIIAQRNHLNQTNQRSKTMLQ